MVCDCAAQTTGGLAELVPVLAPTPASVPSGSPMLRGDPQRARFKPQASGVRNMAVPLKVQGPLTHRHRKTIRPVAGLRVLRPLLDP